MFTQLFKYKIFKLVRTKEELFWSLCFPLILGTLFYASFGEITEKEETFRAVDIGYISSETDKDTDFQTVIEELSKDGENQIVNIVTTSEVEAKELLTDGDIAGIIFNQGEVKLMVNGEGINESILNSFLNQYLQKKETIMQIAKDSPEKLTQVLELQSSDTNPLKEINYTDGSMDNMVSYFYSLIAMSCLYGCFAGMSSAIDMKANLSTLAARRSVAPTNKIISILADFLGTVVVQVSCSLVTVFYLVAVLKVDFGDKIPQILLTVLVGCVIGIAAGLFVGSIGHQSERVKMSIVLCITMVECFLSGLMVGSMKDIVEHHAPIINRINPAALIVDAFYSLNIYDTYDRYLQNMISMLVIASLLCVGSFLIIRRERYASI